MLNFSRTIPIRVVMVFNTKFEFNRYVGYLVSATGNIIANQGFINTFATVPDPATGKPALDANHVALWGAINFASQIFIQMIAPFTADRWGRKFNMWMLTLFLLLVSLLLMFILARFKS